ncbi:hypothetical protein AB0E11_00705 [Streptomyces fradiae]|uniref:hypothetical protein n=1 Tax=Streptomyces TaxID=1883 RepID=UPI002F41B9E6
MSKNSPGYGSDSTTLVFGVTGLSHDHEGLALSTDHVHQVRLPSRISTDDVRRMTADFEILAEAFRENPEDVARMLEAHARRDTDTSRALARSLGFTEDRFEERGGGIIWAVVGAAVVCDVFTGCLTSWAWDGV